MMRSGNEGWVTEGATTEHAARSRGAAERGPVSSKGMMVIAAAGDALVFTLFAALGRNQHHEATGLLAALVTAWPFAGAWLVVGPFRGAFATAAVRSPGHAVKAVLKSWPLAWPLGLLARAVLQQRGIPVSFDLVVLVTNLV